MAKRKKAIWVVVICEIGDSSHHVIETISHVASSLRLAETNLREGWTAPFSWYRVERRLVDDSDSDPREVRYYSHKGRALKAAPEKRAIASFARFLCTRDQGAGGHDQCHPAFTTSPSPRLCRGIGDPEDATSGSHC
jgi:hypothetical protein